MSDTDFHERFERRLFEKMPTDLAATFSDQQIAAIKTAFGGDTWDGHRVDLRGTIPLPSGRWYYAFVAGPDRRARLRPHPPGRPGAAARFFGAALALFMALLLALVVALGFVV